jgi:Tfp pilus assembly protein PilN
MISVNLLPEEYRRRAKSPIGIIAAISAAVLINASLFASWGYLHFGVKANVATTRDVLQADLAGLQWQVDYHNSLKAEIATRSQREQTLAEITKDRVLWTKTLDELIDVVHAGREGVDHFIWFNDLAAEVKADRNNHGQLTGDGVSGAEAYAQLANFAEDLEDTSLSSLMGIFEAPEPLQATQEKPDETLIPSVTWSFPLRMNLLSPQDRVKNREAVEGDDQ